MPAASGPRLLSSITLARLCPSIADIERGICIFLLCFLFFSPPPPSVPFFSKDVGGTASNEDRKGERLTIFLSLSLEK